MIESDIHTRMHIAPTTDEALVLFECLSRFRETGSLTIIDQAEKQALCNLLCDLEKVLVAPFQENYLEQLRDARDRLRFEAS